MGYLDLILKDIRRAERNLRLMVEASNPAGISLNLRLLEEKVRNFRSVIENGPVR